MIESELWSMTKSSRHEFNDLVVKIAVNVCNDLVIGGGGGMSPPILRLDICRCIFHKVA